MGSTWSTFGLECWQKKSLKRRRGEKKQTKKTNYDESYSQTGKSSPAKRCGAKTKTTAATKPAFVCAVWLFHYAPPPFFSRRSHLIRANPDPNPWVAVRVVWQDWSTRACRCKRERVPGRELSDGSVCVCLMYTSKTVVINHSSVSCDAAPALTPHNRWNQSAGLLMWPRTEHAGQVIAARWMQIQSA